MFMELNYVYVSIEMKFNVWRENAQELRINIKQIVNFLFFLLYFYHRHWLLNWLLRLNPLFSPAAIKNDCRSTMDHKWHNKQRKSIHIIKGTSIQRARPYIVIVNLIKGGIMTH